jgi:hypothetical protein
MSSTQMLLSTPPTQCQAERRNLQRLRRKSCIFLYRYAETDTETHNSIRKGNPIDRICIVLEVSDSFVTVTYTATFRGSTTLPFKDKSLWYPVAPAEKEGNLEPLPAVNEKAQWVSLRRKQRVTSSTVITIIHGFYHRLCIWLG